MPMKDFIRNSRTQEPLPGNVDNVRFFLLSLSAEVRWNAWLERVEIKTDEHASKLSADFPHWKEWTAVDDTIMAILRTFASRTGCDFRPDKGFLTDSLISLARTHTVDPALDRLDHLASDWDGTPRLDTWLSRSCGVPDDGYHKAVARNIVGGMVRRIREPGCKHDCTALLIGEQGTGKSSLVAMIAPQRSWFSDEILLGDESKELVLSLAGKALIEISELSGSSRDVTRVKAMLSRQVDRGRTAYARFVAERPRRNIFIATTNDQSALIDRTGNRRFLPVRVDREIDLAWLAENIDQIVGEAARIHSQGVSFDLPRSVWGEAATHQESVRAARAFETYLNDWLAPAAEAVYIKASDLLTCVRSVDSRATDSDYSPVMKKLGFERRKKWMAGKTEAVWCRGDLSNSTRLVPRPADGVMRPSRWLSATPVPTPGETPLPVLPTT